MFQSQNRGGLFRLVCCIRRIGRWWFGGWVCWCGLVFGSGMLFPLWVPASGIFSRKHGLCAIFQVQRIQIKCSFPSSSILLFVLESTKLEYLKFTSFYLLQFVFFDAVTDVLHLYWLSKISLPELQ